MLFESLIWLVWRRKRYRQIIYVYDLNNSDFIKFGVKRNYVNFIVIGNAFYSVINKYG